MATQEAQHNDLFKRKGKFEISEDILHNIPNAIQHVFGQVIIVNADFDYFRKVFIYYGYSDSFEIVPDGIKEPQYYATIDNDMNVTWSKM